MTALVGTALDDGVRWADRVQLFPGVSASDPALGQCFAIRSSPPPPDFDGVMCGCRNHPAELVLMLPAAEPWARLH